MTEPAEKHQTPRLPPLTPSAALRWDVVARLLPNHLGDVLEIGCGKGAVATRLKRRARSLLAIEPDAASYAAANTALKGCATVKNIDSTALPSGSKFETICAFEVLEHIENDVAALEHWLSLLKPGGTLAISVPAHAKRMGAADRLVGHFRRYDPAVIEQRLHEAGFKDVRVTQYGYPAGLALEAGRNWLAARQLRRGAEHRDYAARTSASGRFLQPHSGFVGLAVSFASKPLIALQRLFPDRGPGLVVTAKRAP